MNWVPALFQFIYMAATVAFAVGLGILIMQCIIFMHRKNKQLKE
ncbi:hypothetical protein [Salicibibacter halophilus]|nr:hypothetical protein [Salicibibacter halophilus]